MDAKRRMTLEYHIFPNHVVNVNVLSVNPLIPVDQSLLILLKRRNNTMTNGLRLFFQIRNGSFGDYLEYLQILFFRV
jgi:hypothetical protein